MARSLRFPSPGDQRMAARPGDVTAHRARLEALLEISCELSRIQPLESLLGKMAEACGQLLDSDSVGIRVRDGDDLVLAGAYGASADAMSTPRLKMGESLSGVVAASGEPLVVWNPADDPRLTPAHREAYRRYRAFLGVPLTVGAQVLGVLSIRTRREHGFSLEDLHIVGAFAAQAAIALENARLYRQTEERAEKLETFSALNARLLEESKHHQARLEALLSASRELSGIQPVVSLLKSIAEACGRLLGSESVGFRLMEGDELVVSGSWGDNDEIMLAPRLKIGESLSGMVAARGEPLVVTDLANDARLLPAHREANRRLGYQGMLVVPVKVGERVVGVLSIRTRRLEGFSAEDETTATAFASQAATALENARLFQQVQISAEEVSRAKDALLQAQKMEAIGRLAGGVAHDFNNLLTIIHGRCEILLKRLEPGTKPLQDLELIQRTALRAAALTKQLLAFSRQQVLQPQILSVNAAVSDSVSMLRRLIGEDISLVTLPGAPRDSVKADRTQLEQVLMNLAINARDAMPRGGRLVIETAEAELDEVFVREHPDASIGPHVRLSVADDGVGMSPEVVARIFEPFFTTKDKGRGTGLGLSMVYGIVKQHNGCIGVRSAQGKG